MRFVLLFFMFFFSFVSSAQVEDSLRIAGNVAADDGPLEGVYVRNMTKDDYTLTTKYGNFTLVVSLGDTLRLTYMGMKDEVHAITADEIAKEFVQLTMEPDVEMLDEVAVEQNRISAVSLGIIPKEIKQLSKNERKLKAATDTKGGGLDPIINAITGRTKKLKKRLAAAETNMNADSLYERFYVFCTTSLKIESDDVMPFMYYLVEQNKTEDLMKAETDLAEFLLTDAYINYQDYLKEQKE